MTKTLTPFLALAIICIGCKDEPPPEYTGKWESRRLDTVRINAGSWRLGRVDSTMYDVALDSTIAHSGKWSAHVFSVADSPTYTGYLAMNLEVELVHAKRVKLTAWSRSENTSGTAYMYVRMGYEPKEEMKKTLGKKIYEEISEFAGVEEMPEWMLHNEQQTISGTSDWKKHEFVFDVPMKAHWLWFGAILEGKGKIWVDDFSYTIVEHLPTDSTYKDRSSYIVKPKGLDFEYTE